MVLHLRYEMEVSDSMRMWLRRTTFVDGEEIWAAVSAGDQCAKELVLFSSQLRYNRKSRYSFAKLITTLNRPNNKKRGPFLRSVFLLYSTMRGLCVPRRVGQEHDALYNLTKEQRTLLSGSGLVQQRRESIRSKAVRCQQQFQTWSRNKSLLVHMDNFNRLRYLANPAKGRDQSINACAFAAIRLPSPMPLFHAYPTLLELNERIPGLATAMSRACANLIADTANIATQAYKWSDIRAPLDVRRSQVTSAYWRSWQLTDCDTSKQQGLVEALEQVQSLSSHCGASHVPILVDVNLYSRCMKLMYSTTYTSLDIRSWFRSHPMHFGIWHAYKQCVHAVYNAYLPFFVYMEYEGFRTAPATTAVGNFPKLITKECMIASFLLHGNTLKGRLQQGIANMRHSTAEGAAEAVARMTALQHLLYQYVPACFLLGFLVREAFWNGAAGNTGNTAYTCLQYAYIILLALGGERSTYCYNIAMALLQWQDWHSSMPAMAYQEEALEAMLGRLATTMRSDFTVHTIDEMNMLFASLRVTEVHKPQDLGATHLSKTLCDRVKSDFGDLYRAIISGDLPFVKHDKKARGSVKGSWEWPANFTWPVPLFQKRKGDTFVSGFGFALRAIAGPSRISDDSLVTTLSKLTNLLDQAGIPPSTDEDVRRRQQEVKAFLPSRKRKRAEVGDHVDDEEDNVDLSICSIGIQVSLPCPSCHRVPDDLNTLNDHGEEDDVHPPNNIDHDWEPVFDDFEDF